MPLSLLAITNFHRVLDVNPPPVEGPEHLPDRELRQNRPKRDFLTFEAGTLRDCSRKTRVAIDWVITFFSAPLFHAATVETVSGRLRKKRR